VKVNRHQGFVRLLPLFLQKDETRAFNSNRKLILSSAVIALLAFFDLNALAAADKVQITTEKKQVEEGEGKNPGPGRQAKSSASEKYELKIQNASFSDLANLTVDYIVFVERQKLGQKQGSETTERKTGSKKD
jgi:hypothetical protein